MTTLNLIGGSGIVVSSSISPTQTNVSFSLASNITTSQVTVQKLTVDPQQTGIDIFSGIVAKQGYGGPNIIWMQMLEPESEGDAITDAVQLWNSTLTEPKFVVGGNGFLLSHGRAKNITFTGTNSASYDATRTDDLVLIQSNSIVRPADISLGVASHGQVQTFKFLGSGSTILDFHHDTIDGFSAKSYTLVSSDTHKAAITIQADVINSVWWILSTY